MKRDTRCVVLLVVCVLGLAFSAPGETVKIKTYDVKSAMRSGYGCWYHAYFGTISDSGRTSSLFGTCTPEGSHIADYSGGSGTLNDNIFSSTTADNQVFSIELAADDGQPVLPAVTLHLDGTFRINRTLVFGGYVEGYVLPGALSGATVEINGTTVDLPVTPIGSPNSVGLYPDGALVLTGTPLEGLPTSEIVLKNFKASIFGGYYDHFSLTEIQLDAAVTHFSAFNAGGEIEGNRFEIQGGFMLGAGTNGINPLTEDVVLQLGTFSVTIPSGSFKSARGGSYKFEGTIGGVALEIYIAPAGTNRYTFAAEASGANLNGTVNPVSVALTIGDDAGTTTVSARQ
jgi:hypothetical protein